MKQITKKDVNKRKCFFTIPPNKKLLFILSWPFEDFQEILINHYANRPIDKIIKITYTISYYRLREQKSPQPNVYSYNI